MRRALRFGMIAVGAVLVALGVGTAALLFTPARAFMPEAPWGNFVLIAFYIGLPAGIFFLGLALTDHTYLLSNQRAGRS